jgi:hypothetical protein
MIGKLAETIGENHYIKRIIENISSKNYIQVNDNLTKSKVREQTIGDPMSPLLFNIATMDAKNTVKREHVKVYDYADDIAVLSESRAELQKAFDDLSGWATETGLKINTEKTVTMVFRRGRVTPNNMIHCYGNQIKTVDQFPYLGITLQPHGTTFTQHVKEKARCAIVAMNDIGKRNKLSLKTASKLFKTKIMPILTYGIELIWDHLTERKLS